MAWASFEVLARRLKRTVPKEGTDQHQDEGAMR